MRLTLTCIFLLLALPSWADDAPSSAPAASAPVPNAVPNALQRRVRPTGARPASLDAPAAAIDGQPAAQFATEARWEIAGYNNEELIYTIIITNQDSRVIRCNTQIQGSYVENGEKRSLSDRQVTTVFPNQSAPVGNWTGMDQNSGAQYSTKCRPL